MAVGFVLVTTMPGKEHEIYLTMKKIPEVKEIYPVFGDYDIIAKIDAKDIETLGNVVVGKIRSIPGIAETKTLTTGIEL